MAEGVDMWTGLSLSLCAAVLGMSLVLSKVPGGVCVGADVVRVPPTGDLRMRLVGRALLVSTD